MMNKDDEQWWRAITAVCFCFEREVQHSYYEQWRNSECICFNLLTLLAGLRRGKCCGQGRQPQQLSEAKDYLLRSVEKSKQLKDLFAAVPSITASINIPSEYLLRSQVKPQQLIHLFFLILFAINAASNENRSKWQATNKIFSTSEYGRDWSDFDPTN